jgi:hypothetical protein
VLGLFVVTFVGDRVVFGVLWGCWTADQDIELTGRRLLAFSADLKMCGMPYPGSVRQWHVLLKSRITATARMVNKHEPTPRETAISMTPEPADDVFLVLMPAIVSVRPFIAHCCRQRRNAERYG